MKMKNREKYITADPSTERWFGMEVLVTGGTGMVGRNLIKTLEESILNKIIIRGIVGINKAIMNKDNTHVTRVGDDYVQRPQWLIYTDGSVLLDLLNHEKVDFTKTISNQT